jgi:hypothetical protein
MELTLVISMDNSAFEECNGNEIARIFRQLADKAEGSLLDGVSFPVLDINGNKVGKLEID